MVTMVTMAVHKKNKPYRNVNYLWHDTTFALSQMKYSFLDVTEDTDVNITLTLQKNSLSNDVSKSLFVFLVQKY